MVAIDMSIEAVSLQLERDDEEDNESVKSYCPERPHLLSASVFHHIWRPHG